MKWHKNNKHENTNERGTIPGKKLEAFNYTPVSYSHSDEWNSAMNNKEAWAEDKLKGIPVNELSDDCCDPRIEALCVSDTAHARSEYIDHVRVIKEIIDCCESELVRAKGIKACLIEDKNKYADQLLKLEQLQERLRTEASA